MKRCNTFSVILASLVLVCISSSVNAQIQWTQTGPGEAVIDLVSASGKSYLLTDKGFYSTNDDNTWQKLRSVAASDGYNSVVALGSGELYLFGYNFYSVSTDAGASWKKVSQPGFSTRKCVSDDLGNLYAGENDPIMLSTDKGLTWTKSDKGTSGGFFDIAAFAVAPNGDIYAGNQGITGGMVYRSTDHGGSWKLVHSENMNDVSFITTSDSAIWIAYTTMLMYSTDNGITWKTALPTKYPITSLLFTGAKEALAGMYSVGLFSTVDRGNSWFSNGWGIHGKRVSKLARSLHNTIFCGTDSGLFISAGISNGVRNPQDAGIRLVLTPNPARNEVSVTTDFPIGADVQYVVYDPAGRTILSTSEKAGEHQYVLNTTSLESGSYYIAARSKDEVRFGKLMVMK